MEGNVPAHEVVGIIKELLSEEIQDFEEVQAKFVTVLRGMANEIHALEKRVLTLEAPPKPVDGNDIETMEAISS
jgi:hypothetical protein